MARSSHHTSTAFYSLIREALYSISHTREVHNFLALVSGKLEEYSEK